MNFFYIVNARIPTKKAHGIQVVKMCEAFAKNGMDVELVVPRRWGMGHLNLQAYYGSKIDFKVRRLFVIDLMPYKIPGAFYIQTVTFCISAFFFFLFTKGKHIIYARGEVPLVLFPILSKKKFSLFFESHIKPLKLNRYKRAFLKSDGIVVVTKYYEKELKEILPTLKEKIIYAPDGVDFDAFSVYIDKNKARESLCLPQGKKIAMYTGSSVAWKGLGVLIKAGEYLPSDYLVVYVGDIKGQDDSKNMFVGQKQYQEIPLWLQAADALILTGDPSSKISSYYTSPLKMFEYMASLRPIVACDVLSFRDILNTSNSYILLANSSKDLALGIENAIENEEFSAIIARQAQIDTKQYSWDNRAKGIINFIKSCTNFHESEVQ